jgi:hypothetical protein
VHCRHARDKAIFPNVRCFFFDDPRSFKHTFISLWAIMRLQVIPDKLGGAGKFRIEWEIDDAVFKEAA